MIRQLVDDLNRMTASFALLQDPEERQRADKLLADAKQRLEERKHMNQLLADGQICAFDHYKEAVEDKIKQENVTTQELAWMHCGLGPEAHRLSPVELQRRVYWNNVARISNTKKYPDRHGTQYTPPPGFDGIDDKAFEIALRHCDREKWIMHRVES